MFHEHDVGNIMSFPCSWNMNAAWGMCKVFHGIYISWIFINMVMYVYNNMKSFQVNVNIQ